GSGCIAARGEVGSTHHRRFRLSQSERLHNDRSPEQTRVEKKPSTTKRMIIGVVLLIALIAGIKVLMVMHMIHNMPKPTPAVVTTAVAEYQTWQPTVDSVGTLRAVRGADLALDIAGLVTQVNMKSGDDVKQGQVLVQLRDTEDVALLQQLQAAAALSRVTYERAK